ncbi:MAG: hypothetical protein JEZ12_13155 [Desulfobacterium sp.]|nr:hypothetical protein [Desulfobacterium sp.]
MAARVSKLNVWLKHYLDESCSTTFLNKTASVRAAGYKTTNPDSLRNIGCQNFTKLSDKINEWLDENGLSEAALKMKMLGLLNAKDTKFQKIKGPVTGELPDHVSQVATTVRIETDEQGKEHFSDGETLVAIGTDAIETQRRTLDMALKIKGMYEADNHQKGPQEIFVTVGSGDD